jgi:hypothetical protein
MDGTTRRASIALVAAVAVGAVAVGVVLVADAVGGSRDRQRPTPVPAASVASAGAAPKPSAEQLRGARDLLARWERIVGDAVYVPLQPPLGQGDPHIGGGFEVRQTGSWSRGQEAYRLGLDQRRIRIPIEIPDRSPRDGVITWRNGSSVRIPVGSATEAYDRLLDGAMRCGNCPADGTMDGITPRPVTLAAVRLTTLVVQTTRGQATVPAWQFSFAEIRVRLLVAAAKAARVEPAPGGAGAGMPVFDAWIAPDGTTLSVRFGGARPSSRIPCGADYFGYPVESANAVGVVITVRAYPRPATCTMEGYGREVTVRLAAPLAGRSVLELQGGTAVPLTRRR